VAIAGHEVIGTGLNGALQEHVVGWVFPNGMDASGGNGDDGSPWVFEKAKESLDQWGGYPCVTQDCQILFQD
jgi:hypothetical protein